MFSGRLLLGVTAVAATAVQAYDLVQIYDSTNFFEEFYFWDTTDPTGGDVVFDVLDVALANGIVNTNNSQVYLGVDYWTLNPVGGRQATRLTSNVAYNQGLFIADFAHMPVGCGVWPAYWMFGPDWPTGGEFDIIEGVNFQTTNQVSLHTGAGCHVNNTGSMPGTNTVGTNCNSGGGSLGCGVTFNDTATYGVGFNEAGGGVWAMEWTATAVNYWFFERSNIPLDIAIGVPDTNNWGLPIAAYNPAPSVGCDFSTFFVNQSIVIETDFCGTWADSQWGGRGGFGGGGGGPGRNGTRPGNGTFPFNTTAPTNVTTPTAGISQPVSLVNRATNATVTNTTTASCATLATTCNDFVAANPASFEEAYWTINYVAVYQ